MHKMECNTVKQVNRLHKYNEDGTSKSFTVLRKIFTTIESNLLLYNKKRVLNRSFILLSKCFGTWTRPMCCVSFYSHCNINYTLNLIAFWLVCCFNFLVWYSGKMCVSIWKSCAMFLVTIVSSQFYLALWRLLQRKFSFWYFFYLYSIAFAALK